MTTSPIELKQKNICLYITLSVSDPWIWRFWPDREQSGKPCEFRKKLEQRGPLQHFLTMIIQIETGGVWLRQPPWSFSSTRGQSEIDCNLKQRQRLVKDENNRLDLTILTTRKSRLLTLFQPDLWFQIYEEGKLLFIAVIQGSYIAKERHNGPRLELNKP